MTITSIDRFSLGVVQTRIAKALKDLGDELGLDITYGGGHFSNGMTGDVKLKLAVRAAAGSPSAAEVEFKRYCGMFGLVASDYDRQFASNGKTFRISGIKASAPKFPIIAIEHFSKKPYKFPLEIVKAALARETMKSASTKSTAARLSVDPSLVGRSAFA